MASSASVCTDWRSKSGAIMHDDCPQIPPTPQRPTKPTCHAARFCLCSAHGIEVWSVRNRFLRLMKTVINSTVMKREVDSRMVFAHLEGEYKPAADAEEAFLRELAELTGESFEERSCDIWVCLGAHCWSPYRSTYKMMKPSTIPQERVHPNEVHLEACV